MQYVFYNLQQAKYMRSTKNAFLDRVDLKVCLSFKTMTYMSGMTNAMTKQNYYSSQIRCDKNMLFTNRDRQGLLGVKGN